MCFASKVYQKSNLSWNFGTQYEPIDVLMQATDKSSLSPVHSAIGLSINIKKDIRLKKHFRRSKHNEVNYHIVSQHRDHQ